MSRVLFGMVFVVLLLLPSQTMAQEVGPSGRESGSESSGGGLFENLGDAVREIYGEAVDRLGLIEQAVADVEGSGVVMVDDDINVIDDGAINESQVRSVTLFFVGLDPEEEYVFCKREKSEGDCDAFYSISKFKKSPDENGTLAFVVCAAGDDELRIHQDLVTAAEGELKLNNPGSKDYCGDDNYFHSGSIYSFGIYEDGGDFGGHSRVLSDAFYVTHFFPNLSINGVQIAKYDNEVESTELPEGEIKIPLSNPREFEVAISGVRPGGDDRNNYQVHLESMSQQTYDPVQKCFTVNDDGGAVTVGKGVNLPYGGYLMKVSDQDNEANGFSSFLGKDDCQGGFTFYHVYFAVQEGDDGRQEIIVYNIVSDPNNSNFSKKARKQLAIPDAPCAEGSRDEQGRCTGIMTALGSVSIKPSEFLGDIFRIVMSVAGLAVIGLLVYGGYNILTSKGDPEQIQKAREIITSAIIGLAFIIFSVTILGIIGVDILVLPGFTR